MSKDPPRIKAIFIDVDGTLLSHSTRQIPESAKSSLKTAKEHGILLFIATGRHKSKLDFDPMILGPMFSGHVTLNGQFCFSGDRVLLSNPIHPDEIRLFVDLVSRKPFPAIFTERDVFYATMIDRKVEETHADLKMPLPEIGAPERALENDIYAISIFGSGEYPYLLKTLRRCDFVQWFWGREGGWDIMPRNGSKWAGILSVLDHFNIPPDQAATIGDCDNDIEMLANAGYSIAMGNASEPAKEHARCVTSDIDDDGLSKAIERILSLGAGG